MKIQLKKKNFQKIILKVLEARIYPTCKPSLTKEDNPILPRLAEASTLRSRSPLSGGAINCHILRHWAPRPLIRILSIFSPPTHQNWAQMKPVKTWIPTAFETSKHYTVTIYSRNGKKHSPSCRAVLVPAALFRAEGRRTVRTREAADSAASSESQALSCGARRRPPEAPQGPPHGAKRCPDRSGQLPSSHLTPHTILSEEGKPRLSHQDA